MPAETLEMLTRATSVSGSLNVKERTIDVIFASEQAVRRRSWDIGSYDEVLLCDRANVDLSRADNMSLLDSHGAYNLDDRLGTVVPGSIRFERGQVIARVKLSRKARAEDLMLDLQDGMSLPISVGYRILKEERTEAAQGEVPTIRATLWQPMEISVVPIPADPNAKTRGIDMPQTEQHERQEQQQRQAPTNVIHERTRVKELRGWAKMAQVEDAILERAIDEGTTVEQFRNALLEQMVERQDRAPTFPHAETRGVHENRYDGLTRNQAMADALMLRLNPDHKLKGSSRDFVGLSLVEIARRTLEANGISAIGQGAGETITRALHTTSDFGIVISDVGKTVLLASYAATPSALKAVGKRAIVKDFKTKNAVRLTKTGGLQKVNEHGEFKRGSFTESKESYRVDTFGEIIGMSRQMLINDDLGAFADRALLLAQQATRFEAKFLVSLLKSNPIMGDGKELFHAAHKNLAATAIVLNHTTLAAGRKSFRKQTDDAGEPIGLGPKYLVVGPEQETTAEQVLAQIQPAHTGDVNVFAGKLQLVVEDRLGDSPEWYLVADPNLVPGLEYAYLEGFEGPYFEDNWGFNVDGVETKVRLDFGGGFMDWRGWYKNPGIAQ